MNEKRIPMDLENDIEMVVRALTNEHLHVRIEHGDFDMEDEAAHLENSALILLDRASSGADIRSVAERLHVSVERVESVLRGDTPMTIPQLARYLAAFGVRIRESSLTRRSSSHTMGA